MNKFTQQLKKKLAIKKLHKLQNKLSKMSENKQEQILKLQETQQK